MNELNLNNLNNDQLNDLIDRMGIESVHGIYNPEKETGFLFYDMGDGRFERFSGSIDEIYRQLLNYLLERPKDKARLEFYVRVLQDQAKRWI